MDELLSQLATHLPLLIMGTVAYLRARTRGLDELADIRARVEELSESVRGLEWQLGDAVRRQPPRHRDTETHGAADAEA